MATLTTGTVCGGMAEQTELLTKAAQTAAMLTGDVRDSHRAACEGDRVLEILLRDLIRDAVAIERRLNELEGCFR